MRLSLEVKELSSDDLSQVRKLLINANLAHSDLIESRVKQFGVFNVLVQSKLE